VPKAVRYDHYGGPDVLKIVEVERPIPRTGQALVEVKAAGINPGEAKIRKGMLAERWPSTFPSGQGSDFAGVVVEGAGGLHPGDEVIGFTHDRASQAEFVAVDAEHLTPKPAEVSWEQAGALFVAGSTAWAMVDATDIRAGDTVAISGAAGGVGSIAIQLAKLKGATVIGIASEANHDWLTQYGAIPVTYGEGVKDRIRRAANGKLDAFLDTQDSSYVELALELGVEPQRIDTIVDFTAGEKWGVKTDGNMAGARAEVLAELAGLMAAGKLQVPIADTYPLRRVREAYEQLEQGHTRGKIVLIP
jgi:NADPH:quinone reductase-like Zn-dependent oxidoreductase